MKKIFQIILLNIVFLLPLLAMEEPKTIQPLLLEPSQEAPKSDYDTLLIILEDSAHFCSHYRMALMEEGGYAETSTSLARIEAMDELRKAEKYLIKMRSRVETLYVQDPFGIWTYALKNRYKNYISNIESYSNSLLEISNNSMEQYVDNLNILKRIFRHLGATGQHNSTL